MLEETLNPAQCNFPIYNHQTTTYVKVRTIHMPAVIRRSEMEKLSYLMDQYSKLQANEIDRYQFVKAIGALLVVR
jgi:hypothetical protein